MATDFGYPLSPRFAIHPRPFDRLLATALEIFTRARAGQENEELALVAEHIAFFLDGLCTENHIRVCWAIESAKLTRWSR